MPAFAYASDNTIRKSTISEQRELSMMLSEPSAEDVASVTIGDNTSYYSDFSKAWEAATASDNSKIILLNNITTSTQFTLPKDKTMSVDLNGKLWTDTNATNRASTISINGDLTINDSEGNGGIKVQVSSEANCYRGMFSVEKPQSAELTINAGNFEVDDGLSSSGKSSDGSPGNGEIVYSFGKLNICGGTFKVNSDDDDIFTVRRDDYAFFTISGGNFTNGTFAIGDNENWLPYYCDGSKSQITGGSFRKIRICDCEDISISGILPRGVYFCDSTTDSKITDDNILSKKYIENVTVKKGPIIILGEPKMDSKLEYQRYTDKKLSFLVQKGDQSISGDLTYQWYQKVGDAEAVEIEGANNAEYTLPDNLEKNTYTYYCVVSLNEYSFTSESVTFEIKEFPQVVGVTASDGTYQTYSSWSLAIDAATEGSTIKLLQDITDYEKTNVANKTITIDLNGYYLCNGLNNEDFLIIKNSDITFTNTSGDNTGYFTAYMDNAPLFTADDDSTVRFNNIWVKCGHITAKNIVITSGKFGSTQGDYAYVLLIKQKVGDTLADGVGFWSLNDNKWATTEVLAGNTLLNLEAKEAPVKFTEQSTDKTIYYNYQSAPTLSVTTQVNEGLEAAYQWYSVGTGEALADEKLEGETNTSYKFPSDKSVGQYRYYCLATCDGYTTKSRTITVTVGKSGAALQFVLNPEYTYGDVISTDASCTVTGDAPLTSNSVNGLMAINSMLSASLVIAPTSDQMALFSNSTQLCDAVSKDESGNYLLSYDTKNKLIPIGQNVITVKYIGNDNIADAEDSVNITLNKKPITNATIKNDETHKIVYNGTTSFTNIPLNLNSDDILTGDTVEGTLNCTVSDKNVGTHTFTAKSVNLSGTDAGYYSLDKSAVTGNIEIVPYDIVSKVDGMTVNTTVLAGNGQFVEPKFSGVEPTDSISSEYITGTIVYQYGDKSNMTHDDLVKELAKLESDQYVNVNFTLTANGNYTGVATGTLRVGIISAEFTGSCPVKENPVYGDTWGEIIKLDQNNFSTTYQGEQVAGTYKIQIEGVDIELTSVPKNGTFNYSILFTANEDSRFTDIEVQSGTVTIAKCQVNIEWGETTLNYTGKDIAPEAMITNKVNGDDVFIVVTGKQTNVGTDYTATATLDGTDAMYYTLPTDVTAKYSIVPATVKGNVTIANTDNNSNEMIDAGDTLTVDISAVKPAGGTPNYQWKNISGGTTTDLGTDSSYTLTGSAIKGKIYCVVSYSGNTTGSLTSNTMDISKYILKGTITITGDTQLGETLSVNAPENEGISTSDYTIEWYRNDVLIDGENTSTYEITKEDLGKSLKVVITAKADSEGFTGSLTSNEKLIPALAPEKAIVTAKVDGNSVTLNWTKPFGNGAEITGYSLIVKTGDKEIEGSPFAIDKDAISYNVEGLANGTEYSFILSTINSIGSTPSDIVTAKTTRLPIIIDNGGNNDDGDNNGGNNDTNKDDVVVTTPEVTEENPNPATQVTIGTDAEVIDGTINVDINDNSVDDAIKLAQEEAKKNQSEDNGIVVQIEIGIIPDSSDSSSSVKADNLSVNLSNDTIDKLVEADVKELHIVSDVVGINVDLDTIKIIKQTLGTDANISANKVDNDTLSEETKKLVGDRPVFEFTISGTDDNKVTNFGDGSITISIPYTLGENEDADTIVAYYINNNGDAIELSDSYYNVKNQTLEFTTNHFSQFAVGYKQPTVTYSDIENHWAKESIEFVSTLNVFNGTGDEKFSPDMPMTRGMLVTVLGRLANADVSVYSSSQFDDVKSDAYYMGYIEWARENNIVKGKSLTTFAPEENVTREEMAVIIQNYLNYIEFKLQSVNELNIFADNVKISSWASEAVKELQMAGILAGKGNNMFNPQGTATRAEFAKVLKCMIELINSTQNQ